MIDVLKVTKKFLFKEFHRIARKNGVKLNIKSMLGGWYCITENRISINRNAKKQVLPFMFFHELGHSHCCKNNIWKNYHNWSSKTWKGYKSTALKAEKWIDSWAETEVNKFFKNVDSYKPYHTKEGAKEFKKTVDSIDYNYWILTHKKK